MSRGIKPQRFYRLQEQIISAQPVLLTWARPLSGKPRGVMMAWGQKIHPGATSWGWGALANQRPGSGDSDQWEVRLERLAKLVSTSERVKKEGRDTTECFMTQTDNYFLYPLSFIHWARAFQDRHLYRRQLIFVCDSHNPSKFFSLINPIPSSLNLGISGDDGPTINYTYIIHTGFTKNFSLKETSLCQIS